MKHRINCLYPPYLSETLELRRFQSTERAPGNRPSRRSRQSIFYGETFLAQQPIAQALGRTARHTPHATRQQQ